MELNLEYNTGGTWFRYKGATCICTGDLVVDQYGGEYTFIAQHEGDAWVEDSEGNYDFTAVAELQLLVRASTSIEVYRGPADEMTSWL